jgi:Ca2+-binding EF-hand superfamily protein
VEEEVIDKASVSQSTDVMRMYKYSIRDRQMVEKVFEESDNNGDGFIDRRDFREVRKKALSHHFLTFSLLTDTD